MLGEKMFPASSCTYPTPSMSPLCAIAPDFRRPRSREGSAFPLQLCGTGSKVDARQTAPRGFSLRCWSATRESSKKCSGDPVYRYPNRASIASHRIASSATPFRRLISWMPVGEVTLISVM